MRRLVVAVLGVTMAVAVSCVPPVEPDPPGPAVPSCFTTTGEFKVDFHYVAFHEFNNVEALSSGDGSCDGEVLNSFTWVVSPAGDYAAAMARCDEVVPVATHAIDFADQSGVLTPEPPAGLWQCGWVAAPN